MTTTTYSAVYPKFATQLDEMHLWDTVYNAERDNGHTSRQALDIADMIVESYVKGKKVV